MTTPLVSIIIPTFNRAHLIEQTLNSISAQTYTNWECLVIDDGSTDHTATILAKITAKDKRFKYHSRPKEKPKGANACRNYGFELSKGEYINWFDSDDIMYPEKLQIQIDDLYNTDYEYGITQTEVFDVVNDEKLGLRAETLVSENLINEYLNFKCFWLLQAVLWKKDFLKTNKLDFDEELQQAQDYDFHMRVLLVSQNYIANNTITTRLLKHESNMSNSKFDSVEKICSNAKVQRNIVVNFKKHVSSQTTNEAMQLLANYYKAVLRNRNMKGAIKVWRYVIECLLSTKSSYMLIVKASMALAYPLSGIGFKLTKINLASNS